MGPGCGGPGRGPGAGAHVRLPGGHDDGCTGAGTCANAGAANNSELSTTVYAAYKVLIRVFSLALALGCIPLDGGDGAFHRRLAPERARIVATAYAQSW